MLTTQRHAGRLATGQTELIHTIRRCGLTSGLKLCLDAGDANSYSGSGQSWLDTSGNGYDFFRGADGSAAGDDPTFNGTAGRRSSTEYWSFDGGDFFRYHAANETWINNLHKAGAKFTLALWTYFPDLAGSTGLFGTNEGGAGVGMFWVLTADQASYLYVSGTGGSPVLSNTTASGFTIGTWHMMAISLDEAVGANGGFHFVDGVVSSFTSTYSSPSSASALRTAEIAALGNASFPIANTSRLGMFAAWEGVALTQAQLNALYMATRGRFGV